MTWITLIFLEKLVERLLEVWKAVDAFSDGKIWEIVQDSFNTEFFRKFSWTSFAACFDMKLSALHFFSRPQSLESLQDGVWNPRSATVSWNCDFSRNISGLPWVKHPLIGISFLLALNPDWTSLSVFTSYHHLISETRKMFQTVKN